jgi:hypothetical protein
LLAHSALLCTSHVPQQGVEPCHKV